MHDTSVWLLINLTVRRLGADLENGAGKYN